MRRMVAAFVAAVVVGVIAPAAGGARVMAAEPQPVPKVVLVVGPSGAATDRYRAESRAAADLARTFTPDVTELYCPERDLARGQGRAPGRQPRHLHGPRERLAEPLSRRAVRRDPERLRAECAGRRWRRQPTSTSGKRASPDEIRLAPNAVVLLHHLCYASGLSEPGLPEGSIDVARQRIDNYARRASSPPARPRSSPRPTRHRPTSSGRSSAPAGRSSRRGVVPRRPTATCRPSTARAPRVRGPHGQRDRRAPGSSDRSSCAPAWRRRTCCAAPAGPRPARRVPGRSRAAASRACSARAWRSASRRSVARAWPAP